MSSNHRLSGLDNTRDAVNTRPYTAYIRFMKLALPLFAIGLIMVLILWPQITAIKTEPLNEADLKALKRAETENRLLNPVFNTEDKDGRPITITAAQASQKKSDEGLINLTSPSATLTDQGEQSMISADEGTYNKIDKTIILNNNIVISGENKGTLTTDSLTADINNGRAESESKATLTTDQGTITGRKIIIENNGAKTTFQGPAKAVIN